MPTFHLHQVCSLVYVPQPHLHANQTWSEDESVGEQNERE
jgi:hypothetical protein